MLAFCFISSTDAFQHVKDNISEVDGAVSETDLVFLKGLLDNPAVKQMIKVSEIRIFQRCFSSNDSRETCKKGQQKLISFE